MDALAAKTPKAERAFTKNPSSANGVCVIVEDGVACDRDAQNRGLCARHNHLLRRIGRHEEFALPRRRKPRTLELTPFPGAPKGACRVRVNGEPCAKAARGQSGLCATHYGTIWSRSDLKLEDFTVAIKVHTYLRQVKPKEGMCVVRTQFAGEPEARPCKSKAHVRGMCRHHYRALAKDKAAFDRIANPPENRAPVYRLKTRAKDGVCLAVEDGVGCTAPISDRSRRMLCRPHLLKLKQAGVLHKLTDRFLGRSHVLEKRPERDLDPGLCVVMIDGVPCPNPPRRRGVCLRCAYAIQKQGLDFYAFCLASRRGRVDLQLTRKPQPLRGVCAVLENGVPCEMTTAEGAWGLCQRHYSRAMQHGRLQELGVARKEAKALPEAQHFYFDKNVVIRFAMHETFNVLPDRSSVALVEAVLARSLRATVSLDCVRAVYSHLGHRLARPIDEGGKGMDDAAAERQAREYVGKLFYRRGGLWNFVMSSPDAFKECASSERHWSLSLEDALEVELYAIARKKYGCTAFVTGDYGLLTNQPEALPPEAALARLQAGITR